MKKLIIVPLLFICLLAKAQIPGLESMPRMGLPLQSTRLWSNGTRHLISDKDSIALIYFLKPVGTSGQYINGAGGLVTFPTAVSAFTNDATYITQAGARSAISTTGSLSYNSSTGVFSYTQPTNVSAFTNDVGYVTNNISGSLSVTGNGIFTNTVSGQRFAIGNGSNNKAVGAFGPVGVQGQFIASNNVDGTTAANTTTPVVSSYVFGAVTYSAANTGQIYSTSATIDIKGASIASTNVSITAPLSLWVEAGKTLLSGAFQAAANSDFANINSGKLGNNVLHNSASGTTADSIRFVSGQKDVSKALVQGNGILLTQTSNTFTIAGNPAGLIVGTPTIVAGTGAGTSPTVSVTSNGRGLQVTVTTGTLPTGTNATVATVTLANALAYTPYPVFSSGSASTSLLNGASMIYMNSIGSANVTITSGTTALTAATTYVWNIAL